MDNSSKIDPLGFREYDARWLYPEKINGEGIKSVGKGFGSQIIKKIQNPRVAVGHDYRSYSEEVKNNFIDGLISTGCNVEDIGLCLSPTIYFSQGLSLRRLNSLQLPYRHPFCQPSSYLL